jgi:membrane protein implicated in regulation of membrane protease activity
MDRLKALILLAARALAPAFFLAMLLGLAAPLRADGMV